MRALLARLALVVAIAGCSSPTGLGPERVLTVHVASMKSMCQQWWGASECLLVRLDDADPWRPLLDGIVGFTHEQGYEYTLRVQEVLIEDPPADGFARELRLMRIVKRTAVPSPASGM